MVFSHVPNRADLPCLQQQIQRAIKDVLPHIPRIVRDELLRIATSEMLQRVCTGRLNRHHPQFEAGLRRSLRNLGIDLHRQKLTQPAQIPTEWDAPDPLLTSPESGLQQERRIRFRELLEEIRWPAPRRGSVDHFAVFLLYLRVSLASVMAREQIRQQLQPHPDLVGFVEWCLPFHDEEERRILKRNLPGVGEAWTLLCQSSQSAGRLVEGPLIPETLTNHSLPQEEVSSGRWSQWTRRARTEAQSRMDPQDWQNYFANWLPGLRKDADVSQN